MVENNTDILLILELNWMIHFHQVNLKYVDLVCLIDVIEIQWMVDAYYILEMIFQLNF